MAALMSLTQYTARLGHTLTGSKATQAEAFLDDASALVSLVGRAAEDDTYAIDSPEVSAALLPIIFAMVQRGVNNPRGLTSEQLGDYKWASAGQAIYLTNAEERLVLAALDRPVVGVITLEGDLPEHLMLEAERHYPGYIGQELS